MDLDGTDDKIERLVRSVLQAVDARLDDVRNELHAFRDDTQARLAALETALTELQHRTAKAIVTDGGGRRDDTRMEQATQMLLERIEAMHQKTTIATNERLAQLGAAVDELRNGALVPTPADDMAAVSAPLIPSPHLPAIPPALSTRQVPIVAPLPIPPTAPAAPAPTAATAGEPAATSAAPAPVDGIDLDRLSRLLEEHLGQFHLGDDTPPSR